jgi:tubulin polyglutamylase TTLL6/13
MAVQPDLLHNYRMNQPNDRTFQICFEILGFDVMIDEDAKPWLLEVNQAPSFATESDLDHQVKKKVILDTFSLLGLSKEKRKRELELLQKESQMRKMYKVSNSLWHKIMHEDIESELKERGIH